MFVSKIKNKIKNYIWQRNRKKINEKNRKMLKNKDISIISMNCTGGILSHDLGLQFKSPTVNLFFRSEDFIKFCENLEYYLSIDEFVKCNDPLIIEERTYPIAHLGDLTLFLVHYHSVEEAQEKWNERKKRIDPNNIVIMNTDREGMTDELKDRFEKLPYRKVMFTHLPDDKHPSCFYIKGYEDSSCVGIVTDHDTWDGKRPIDQFDYVRFLNGEE
ncbi:MAG: DUF1919 domain-containing protein [Acutalibacteraceae bacterium]